jgi:cellulose synthase/poly-beta-1,6-N-acetylglucosamine synthase-like glycosyltransferase
MQEAPELSIIISTYNRAARLAGALESLFAQDAPGVPFEIIVVNNNSTDDTRAVVEAWQALAAPPDAPQLRYVFEARQGVSYGRNAGVRAARAEWLAFTDDDMRMAPDWVAQLRQAFAAQPDLDYLGGRVWPRWLQPPPVWLTPQHWGPVALLDYGPAPLPVDAAAPRTLITANFALRRAAFEACGGFSPLTQRRTNDVCSTEDQELLMRLWEQGARGAYLPQLLGWAEVPDGRLRKAYHRRWHRGHGHCLALLRDPQLEQTRRGRWLGVPAHVYRQTLAQPLGWLAARWRGAAAEAFWCETRLWFAVGFCTQRIREYLADWLTRSAPARAFRRSPAAFAPPHETPVVAKQQAALPRSAKS